MNDLATILAFALPSVGFLVLGFWMHRTYEASRKSDAWAWLRTIADLEYRHAVEIEALEVELARALPPAPVDDVEWQRIKRAVGL